MNRTLSITAAEWASVTDGTLWIVRDGEQCATPHSCPKFTRQMCRWNGNHPPAEFVQACAPCEHQREWWHGMSGQTSPHYDGENGQLPCSFCRVELVGPMLVESTIETADVWRIVTLGHAYAVGQPLPIHDDDTWVTGVPAIVVTSVSVYYYDGDWWHEIIDRLAHYGPPETLVGRWAMPTRRQ